MICAIDIGNSALKAGVFHDRKIAHSFRLSLEAGPEVVVRDLASRVQSYNLTRIGVSSVVPQVSKAVAQRFENVIPVFQLRHSSSLPIAVKYDTPETLGVDRLAAMVGVWESLPDRKDKPVVVVDAGTAVTIDVLQDGAFIGGPILPGPDLLRKALRRGTAQLPEVTLSWPDHAISRSTSAAIQAGLMFGLVDSVRGVLVRVIDELGSQPLVVSTGGWGNLLHEKIRVITMCDPDLVIKGVAMVTDMN